MQWLDTDFLKKLETKNDVLTAFETDLKALDSKKPVDETEKKRFETMWIKGYWQMLLLSDGTSITFADFGKKWPEEQEKMMGMVWVRDRIRVRSWLAQVANQRKESELTELQVANQNIESVKERREQLNTALSKPAEIFRKLPWDLESKARESALKDPPKELQWATPEAIQSGQYDNIILASYAVNNAQEIANGLSEGDKKLFASAVVEAEDILWGDGRAKFRELTDSLVLGEDRAKIESAGNNLIDRGYNREVAWNPQTRRFTFENALGEKRIIETARIPPQETIEKGILSLSQDIQIPPEKVETTERKKTEKTITNLVDEASKWPFVGALPSSIQNAVQEWLKEAQTQTSSLEKITQAIRLLTLKANEIQKLIERETPGSAEEKVLKESLSTVMKQISALNTLAGQYIKQKNDEKEARRDELDPFHTGKENLERLDRIGLGNLANMDEVTSFLRTLNSGDFANQLTDEKSINSYLMWESLSWWQYQQVLSQLENLYIKITWDTALREKDEQGKVRYLTTPTENGKTRLQNALQSERTKNDGRPLTKADFQRILSREEQK